MFSIRSVSILCVREAKCAFEQKARNKHVSIPGLCLIALTFFFWCLVVYLAKLSC